VDISWSPHSHWLACRFASGFKDLSGNEQGIWAAATAVFHNSLTNRPGTKPLEFLFWNQLLCPAAWLGRPSFPGFPPSVIEAFDASLILCGFF